MTKPIQVPQTPKREGNGQYTPHMPKPQPLQPKEESK